MPHGPMTVDDVILSALEGGPVTVNDITKRFEIRVRVRLNMLRVWGIVLREGRGGAHRKFTYRLLRADLCREGDRREGRPRTCLKSGAKKHRRKRAAGLRRMSDTDQGLSLPARRSARALHQSRSWRSSATISLRCRSSA
jgi:hypothetical protein